KPGKTVAAHDRRGTSPFSRFGRSALADGWAVTCTRAPGAGVFPAAVGPGAMNTLALQQSIAGSGRSQAVRALITRGTLPGPGERAHGGWAPADCPLRRLLPGRRHRLTPHTVR